ncbi:MAG TPA: hypothetical protein VMW54_03365 [Terriglobia bacterium]|nr:hypothetical protein [Terriglobia bacterium]
MGIAVKSKTRDTPMSEAGGRKDTGCSPAASRRDFLARVIGGGVFLAARIAPAASGLAKTSSRRAPRIVNIYNFVRNSDPRMANSRQVLFDATERQLKLLRGLDLPGTFALQYDALINPRYQRLFNRQATAQIEIGAWWEVPRPLAEKAGLKWRGPATWDWDWRANIDFAIGYTPTERKRLADVYMAEFKRVFGKFPATVGSWYIDEVTLSHLVNHYGVLASCNCKDQAGTDGYTLWGGYWNQAYYPSRLNAYMPAQNRSAQIAVPIFRMLGSDPIYQYQASVRGGGQKVVTLEPIYSPGGRSAPWVDWFFKILTREPCLAFAYAQAGQENSFGWAAMRQGLELQFTQIARMARAGALQVETLEQSGRWFGNRFKVTPATSVVALDDWQHQGRKTVWYNSRFFRANFYWHGAEFKVRDIHLFNENVASPYHQKTARTSSMAVTTLPVMDGFLWSSNPGNEPTAGIRIVAMDAQGVSVPLTLEGKPDVTSSNDRDLRVRFSLTQGGTFEIVCQERQLDFRWRRPPGNALKWAMEMTWSASRSTGIGKTAGRSLLYSNHGVHYALTLTRGTFSRPMAAQPSILLIPQQDAVVMALESKLLR